MTRRALGATIVSAAWAAALAGCVLPEPIFEEPPPEAPDQGLVIELPFPDSSTVVAETNPISGDCLVSVSLREVLNQSNAPEVTARFFLNLNNPNANQAVTALPLTFEGSGSGGSTDIALAQATETSLGLINL